MKRMFIFAFIAIFVISFASADFSSSWSHKKNITINESKVIENITDFPLMINIIDSDLKILSSNNGSDILFALDDNTKLDHQIELYNSTYNSTSAQLIAWVRVNLTSGNNVIWMYFNSTNNTKQENPTGVWRQGYKGIYHLSESSGNVVDSTVNSYNSTSSGGTPDYKQTGKIGHAVNFDANSNEYFNLGDISAFDFAGDYAISAWFKTTQNAQYAGIAGKLTTTPTAFGYALQVHNGLSQIWIGNGSYFAPSGNSVNNNIWHQFYLVRNENNHSFYIDGVYQASVIANGSVGSTSGFYIGSWGSTTYDYTGLVDELTIANSSRSLGFIRTSFNNQNDSNSFYKVGSLVQTQFSQNNNIVNFSNFVENPSSNNYFAVNQNYSFNVTISGNNGTAWVEFNNKNYTSFNLSGTYNVVINNLAAGSYNYRWWTFSNESTRNLTVSQSRNYVIASAPSNISLTLNGSSADISINRGSSIYLNCSKITGESGISLYNEGNLIGQGNSVSNLTSFNVSGTYNISCVYSATVNYSQSLISYIVNVNEIDIDVPVINFYSPTPSSGTVTDNRSFEFYFESIEKNLNKLIFGFDNVNYSVFDRNLVLLSNFENNSEFNESYNYFDDSSLYGNDASCTNCPNIVTPSRFTLNNPNDDNLLFLERFNSDLSNWNISSYGGEVSIVSKDFSNKLLLNDTASFSYIYSEKQITEPSNLWVLEYDVMYSSGSVNVMELLDSMDNIIAYVDLGNTLNTISFATDEITPSNATFNSGIYKQVVLKIDKNNDNIKTYISENDGTYGSLSLVASKNYSGNTISKIRFRTGQTQTGTSYLDEIKIYNPVLAIIGDSITDGKRLWSTHPAYPEGRLSSVSNESSAPNYKIGQRICTNCWVANRAFGGSTTSTVNTNIQNALLDHGFKQIYIAIGHNDLAASVSLATMQSNFDSIISKTLASGINASNIMIANVFPGSDLNTISEIQNRNDWNAWLLNKSIELGAIYVDLDLAIRDPSNINQILPSLNSGDGVHLNNAGNEVLANTVTNAINNRNSNHGFKAVRFDGVNDQISFTNGSVTSPEKITLTFWSKFDKIQNSSIIFKRNSYRVDLLNGIVKAEINVGGQNLSLMANESSYDGRWHGYALSYNGSSALLYIDGNLKASNTSLGTLTYSAFNLSIGSDGTSFYNGTIDEIKIYNQSFSNDEIKKLSNFEIIKLNSTLWRSYVNITNLTQKTYYYKSFAFDSNSFYGESTTRNFTIVYDNTLPSLNIINPTSRAYNESSVFLNYTASDESSLDTCWYSLDASNNVTLSLCSTTSISSLSEGNHTLTVYVNDSVGNVNYSTVSFVVDSLPPMYSNIVEAYLSTYSNNYSYFNVTWSDAVIGTVFFESNFSGILRNYTMQSLGNGVYGFSGILPAGTFAWKSFANDSFGHINFTDTRLFTIQKSGLELNLYINNLMSNQTLTYGVTSNVSAISISSGTNLYRNGLLVSNPEITNLSAGYYNYTAVFLGNENYSEKTTSLFLNVTKASPSLNLLLNGYDSDLSINELSTLAVNASSNLPPNFDLELYEDGILIESGNQIYIVTNYSSTGQHIWNVSILESENYTSGSKYHTITILDANYPTFSNLKATPSSPTIYQNPRNHQFNSTWSDNAEIADVTLEFNGNNYTYNDSQINKEGDEYYIGFTSIAAGSYNYRWHGIDSSGNRVATPTQNYTIEKAIGALFLSMSPSNSVSYGNNINIDCVANNPESSLALTRNSALVSIPDDSVLSPGSYNYACTAGATQNYTSASATGSLTVNLARPEISLYVNGLQSDITLANGGGSIGIYANITLLFGAQANISLFIDGIEMINELGSIEYNTSLISGNMNITIYYSGNENYSEYSVSRIVSVSSPPSSSGGGSSGGGGGGGGSSGGGGGVVVNSSSNKKIDLEIENLGDLIITPGVPKTLSINVKNIGDIFLNKCKVVSKKGFEEWFSSKENKNINPGEITEFLFTINVPLNSTQNVKPGLEIDCVEKDFNVSVKLIILEAGMNFEVKKINIISNDQIEINYTLIGNSEFNQDLTIKIFDNEDNLISEHFESIKVLQGKQEKSLRLDISKAEKGLLKISIYKAGEQTPLVEEFFVYDAATTLTGLALLDNVNRDPVYVIAIIIAFIGMALFIVRRIHKIKNWDEKHYPEKKVTRKISMHELIRKDKKDNISKPVKEKSVRQLAIESSKAPPAKIETFDFEDKPIEEDNKRLFRKDDDGFVDLTKL